jgi:hypothetical protein
VTKKNAVFWDVTPCCSSKNRRFGVKYLLPLQVDKERRRRDNVSSSVANYC